MPLNKGNGFICAKQNKKAGVVALLLQGGKMELDGRTWSEKRVDLVRCLCVLLLPSAGVRQDSCPSPGQAPGANLNLF